MRSLRETMRWIQKIFPIRTSLDTPITPRLRKRSREEWGWSLPEEETNTARYREAVRQVRMFLEGKGQDLITRLRRKMDEEAGRSNFEAAAKIRDQIEKISEVIEKQKVEFRDTADRDAVALRHSDDRTILYLLFVRGGKLLGGKGFSFPRSDLPDEEMLGAFLRRYYGAAKLIPQQILIPREVSGRTSLEQWFSELRGKKMSILIPRRGEKKQFLDMAYRKSGQFISSGEAPEEGILADQWKEALQLAHRPRRIEAFDISNIQGRYAVGSMVFFQDGKPQKEGYRHFRIQTVEGANDYAMMKEVLLRRYRRARMEGDLPDLVLLDGGKGQLHVAQEVFAQLGIEGVDLLALAKGRPEGDEGEKIYQPRSPEPILLSRHPALHNFLDRIRDEAHRFAIRYHAKLRDQGAVRSILSEIPGIGPGRQKILLEFFGSVERIKKATVEELTQAPGVSSPTARRIHDFFTSQKESSAHSIFSAPQKGVENRREIRV